MDKFIKKIILLPMSLRLSIILLSSLLTIFFACKFFLASQNTIILENRNKVLQLNNKISQYYRDQKQMSLQQQTFIDLQQQLSSLNASLRNFNQKAPERAVVDSALKSKLKAEEIRISNRLQDEFGYYFLVNIKVTGEQDNVSQFFRLLLEQQELAIWEQLVFQRMEEQLSMSLEIRYYFEFNDDV